MLASLGLEWWTTLYALPDASSEAGPPMRSLAFALVGAGSWTLALRRGFGG